MKTKVKLLTDAKAQITANIMSLKTGLVKYENVNFIRVKSKYYNIVILKDYMPIIGEIEGNVEIELEDNTIKFENIVGYYMHKYNEFNLFIKE